MDRVILMTLGAILLHGGINGVVSGEATGWMNVTRESDPFNYFLSLAISFCGGVFLVWSGWVKKPPDRE